LITEKDGTAMHLLPISNSATDEQKLQYKLLIIQILVFVIPFLVFSFILYQSKLSLEISQMAMYGTNLVLVLAGFIILRQIFDTFDRIAMTIKKADTGDAVDINIHRDVAELRDITTSFNNLMEKFEKTAETLRVCRQSLEKESTDREKAEQALTESEARLKSLLASTEDMIFMHDRNGRILYYNAPPQYGLKEEDVVDKTPFSVFDSETAGRLMQHLDRVVNTCESMTSEEKIVWQGETLWFLLLTSPVTDNATGEVTAVTTISRNITDRKRMEEKMLTTRKLESVGILAGGIAHDFNNLLTAILGYIDLAKMRLKPGEAAYEKLVSAEKASHQAKYLTNSLITFSPGGKPIKQKMAICGVIEDMVHLALSGSKIKSDMAINEDLWPVEVDEGQIGQVIHNLTLNAKEASASGDTIAILAENTVTTSGDGLPVAPGKYIRLSICDQGSGIPKENLSKIFDPYFTTKEMGAQKGMGLGLSVCHSIIKKHDGCITVESEEGKGTAFHVYLPAADREAH
jgi:PAS domain S-box-containing protein